MIYLASPYSHANSLVHQAPFDAACQAAVYLIRASRSVFAPVVMCHRLVRYGLPRDWSFWVPIATE
jgi:hypothetical protein